ncbi:hypothetical protein [Streptosporangium subroseum]|uniref:hypothetical protein n=1 Tax=Streptosporangium subroseum TaxID=106412 RepID=UPI00308EF606|nr:hypothetical protein OHB15_23335 [Streptosporangium subroseum]
MDRLLSGSQAFGSGQGEDGGRLVGGAVGGDVAVGADEDEFVPGGLIGAVDASPAAGTTPAEGED